MLGSVTRQKVCQPLAPEHDARPPPLRVPCACISGISSRATNGKVTKMVASTMPGTAKMILMSCAAEPRAEPALRAEQQHVDQAGDHRRDRERQVDQRDQQALAAELELGDRPGGRDAEDQVERHGDRRGQQRQADAPRARRARSAPRDRPPQPLRNASTKTATSGSTQKQREERQRRRRSAASAPTRGLGDRAAGARRLAVGLRRPCTAPIMPQVARDRGSTHCSRLMTNSSDERDDQHHRRAIAVAPA